MSRIRESGMTPGKPGLTHRAKGTEVPTVIVIWTSRWVHREVFAQW
ncbi:MAG: hypothetical protein WBA57_18380 [Elainellaceae cyanobacterium]